MHTEYAAISKNLYGFDVYMILFENKIQGHIFPLYNSHDEYEKIVYELGVRGIPYTADTILMDDSVEF